MLRAVAKNGRHRRKHVHMPTRIGQVEHPVRRPQMERGFRSGHPVLGVAKGAPLWPFPAKRLEHRVKPKVALG